jgi:hypothetical protein
MEPNVASFTLLYSTSVILLTFNILTLLYDNSVFRKMELFAVWHRSVAFQITLSKKHGMKLHQQQEIPIKPNYSIIYIFYLIPQ